MFRRAIGTGAALAAVVLVAGCSDDSVRQQPVTTRPSTTVGSGDATTTTTSTPGTTTPSVGDVPGLWLITPAGVTTEDGLRFAEPAEGTDEMFRAPVDDGTGGVVFLRCSDGEVDDCAIEHVPSRGADPVALGLAVDLLGVGTWADRPVVVAVVAGLPGGGAAGVDGALTESAAIIDLETAAVVGTYDWSATGPRAFAGDVEAGVITFCVGDGEHCTLAITSNPAVGLTAVAGEGAEGTITSATLSTDGNAVVWVELEPMSGSVTAHQRNLTNGQQVDEPLRTQDQAAPDDVVTDGLWSAVRVGETVYLKELFGQPGVGTRTVPTGTREIAIRVDGSAGAANKL